LLERSLWKAPPSLEVPSPFMEQVMAGSGTSGRGRIHCTVSAGPAAERVHLLEKIAAVPAIASTIPTPSSIIGKKPLPLSLLDRYARTKSSALSPNGAMILAAFTCPPKQSYHEQRHGLLRIATLLTILEKQKWQR
jgi:hypothetical protein